ncbi:MAG TPA: hypothetical protein VFV92_09825 [Candidatus Bathyarchaeia archaeon]|nr:hypothetical protein [Candidatus Bathyarchaeia archaeon]
MPSKALLHEAQQLKNVSGRLELLADEHPTVTDAILTICGTIRSTATILEVLDATKLGGGRPM